MNKKIEKYKRELKKVEKCIEKGHRFYNGKPIMKVAEQLEFEIETRSKFGNKAREAFLG